MPTARKTYADTHNHTGRTSSNKENAVAVMQEKDRLEKEKEKKFTSHTVTSKLAELAACASRIPPAPVLVPATVSHGQSTQRQPPPSHLESPSHSQTPSCSQSHSHLGTPSHSCLGSYSRSRSHPPSQSNSCSLSRTATSAPGLRSGSPQSGKKRAHLLDNDGDEDEEDEEADHHHDLTPAVVHAQKLTNDNSQPKARDYDTWKLANDDSGMEHLILDSDIAKIIKAHGSQARGKAKSKTQSLVEVLYGFDSGCGKSAIKKNCDKAECLKLEKGFVYKELEDLNDPESHRKGMYQHPIIQKAINCMWFKNRRDEGILFETFFKGMPLPAIALLLTAIEANIDEWLTGISSV
ncbi:uncharacterized protein LACBIDRAFT_323308 [Laccaria bicolor S238N-H82]|uniref:Predicted protein n=1 Tax=Laccaria bicolor (strain S238N-H82 / ATCC MYA-4686) TaxID=486041 RepID=B0CZT2_LACBS|nr:uncharacterized protein LACBIDRAFT_323308 [Laccaria bicolor S238N-H82]EDR12207.1 predicted protein [Laccaria bicolor S238N-H82]|eukprot:XP_001876471.1 predicted protein [Laccaria bicolor S238N-H82]